MESGIYCIKNKNGKMYIGSSVNMKNRKNSHFYNLRNNKHANSYLQNAFNKYSESSFTFSVIEYCIKEKLIEREQYHLDNNDFNKLYNIRTKAESNIGFKHSEECCKKRREAKHSEEVKKRISKSLLGNKRTLGFKFSKESKLKKRLINLSKEHHGISPETRVKMIESRRKNIEAKKLLKNKFNFN